jgi:hypothetical protein
MEQLLNEQTKPQSQAVETERVLGEVTGEVSLGKFKGVEALVNAYNSLQSEFTKRCQKIKELESKLQGESNALPKDTVRTNNSSENIENIKKYADLTEKADESQKNDVLKEYLLEVIKNKPTAIMLDGTGAGVKTPVNKPKTIDEAGKLAKMIFNN